MLDTYKQDRPDLVQLGRQVDHRSPDQQLSARSAARLLFGVVRLVAERYGGGVMRSACEALVTCHASWRTKFRILPHEPPLMDALILISGVAHSILPMAGEDNLRAGLAFWATESDPAVWRLMSPGD